MNKKENIEIMILRIGYKYMTAALKKKILVGHIIAGDIKNNFEK